MTTEFTDTIREALNAAKAEVQELIVARSQIDIRITHLSKAIASMSLVCGEPAPPYTPLPLKLTDSCHAVVGAERISEPDIRKKQPTKAEKLRILRQQDYRCLYCERRLESSTWYKGKYILLRINWDHILPFEYSRSNEPENFVACCHVCNHWKATRIFSYLEEIQVYVAEKWQRVETDVGKNLPGMRDGIPH